MPADSPDVLIYYPSYCFRVSPTYNTWVRLTASDIHALTQPIEFDRKLLDLIITSCPLCRNVLIHRFGEESRTFFYLNHPIKYVQLVGIITAFKSFENRWLFVLDDSSGKTVNVTCACRLSPLQLIYDERFDKRVCETTVTKDPSRLGTTSTGHAIDLTGLDVGDVIKVKGLIHVFRNERQISLERISMC